MAKTQIWDDLRCALAFFRHGSAAGAARAFGLSHATILRRLESVEKASGIRLFGRLATG
ncbi:LysR family transcriptional regulator [Mesorhizobium sp. B2-4-17]|nr:LysR family transcriptional regulator [Mesorhizobium sp. B2-4-17]